MSKVSIIIPVYNVEKYLAKCLDSVINQTYKDIEIICVNDGSTDNSFEILKNYANIDDRIKIINKENGGVSIARNIGILNSTAEYILFVDSDDWIESDCVEKVYTAAANNNADIVYFDINYIKDNKIIACYNTEKIKFINKESILLQMGNSCSSRLYKKEFLNTNGIKFPEKIHVSEDNIFNEICHYYEPKYEIIPDKLYNYNVSNEQSATKNAIQCIYWDIEAFNYILNTEEYLQGPQWYKICILSRHIEGLLYHLKHIKNIIKLSKIKQDIRSFIFENDNIDTTLLEKCHNYNKIKICLPYYMFKTFIQNIFSLKNSFDKKHKIITIFGLKIKIKRK